MSNTHLKLAKDEFIGKWLVLRRARHTFPLSPWGVFLFLNDEWEVWFEPDELRQLGADFLLAADRLEQKLKDE